MSIVQAVKTFALRVHGTQYRPNATREPFCVHLAEVASYVADETLSQIVIAGAWLHDSVEDTPTTNRLIAKSFGQELAQIVELLTDPPSWAQKPLHERKLLQANRIASQTDQVKIIKLADQISNIRSVRLDPPIAWDQAKSHSYIDGALLVGRACAGSSDRLDAILESYAKESSYFGML